MFPMRDLLVWWKWEKMMANDKIYRVKRTDLSIFLWMKFFFLLRKSKIKRNGRKATSKMHNLVLLCFSIWSSIQSQYVFHLATFATIFNMWILEFRQNIIYFHFWVNYLDAFCLRDVFCVQYLKPGLEFWKARTIHFFVLVGGLKQISLLSIPIGMLLRDHSRFSEFRPWVCEVCIYFDSNGKEQKKFSTLWQL